MGSGRGSARRLSGRKARWCYIAFEIGLSALLLFGLPMLSMFANGSGAGVTIPYKDFWFQPENRPVLKRLLTGDMLFSPGRPACS